MGRKRDRMSSSGLLPRMEARVYKNTTSYRYHPLQGKPIALGRDLEAAIRRVLDLNGRAAHHGSLRWVWEDYTARSPRWKRLTDGSREDYTQCWAQIEPILGHLPIAAITTHMVSNYVHVERAGATTRANHEKALLSNLFKHGIMAGVCSTNNAKEVPGHQTEPRTEAVDPQVLARFSAWVDRQSSQRRIVGLAARYSALAGNRQVEFRPLTTQQIDWDRGVIRVQRAKQRGAKRNMVWEEIALSPRAVQVLRDAIAIEPKDRPRSNVVFPTRDGNAYSARGFMTMWQRIVADALQEGVITADARFTFHDLRAFYATQYKVVFGELPDLHKNPQTTASIYDRNTVVKRKTL